jgi:hypothetical protein
MIIKILTISLTVEGATGNVPNAQFRKNFWAIGKASPPIVRADLRKPVLAMQTQRKQG